MVQRKLSHQVYRTHACSLDTLRDALWGEHRDIRRQRNNSHILRTTNTRAYAGDCIRGETRKRRLFCTDHGASACRLWPSAPGLEGVSVIAWEAGNFEKRGLCASRDNVADQEDNPWVLGRDDKSDHLQWVGKGCARKWRWSDLCRALCRALS